MEDDFGYADACMIQAASNDRAEELFRLSDEDFLDYIIENGIDCDYVMLLRILKHGRLLKG